MESAYRYFGGEGKPPLVILHGLFGSSRNWQAVAPHLVRHYEVFALDLRNHGESPHTETMDYSEMLDDLRQWLDHQDLDPVSLLGHSLGGKVAMAMACRCPEYVSSLVVVDIAPKRYPPGHDAKLGAMLRLELSSIRTRSEAEARLHDELNDWPVVKFLSSNLMRLPDEGFRWRINLTAVAQAVDQLYGNPLSYGNRFDGPVLFMRGSKSHYIDDLDRDRLERYFPGYILSTIRNAGHNIHTDNQEAFLAAMEYFRESCLAPQQR